MALLATVRQGEIIDLNITAEWLQSWGDDDYEPSGLMTPRDRAELERRKAAHLSASAEHVTDKAGDAENSVAVSTKH